MNKKITFDWVDDMCDVCKKSPRPRENSWVPDSVYISVFKMLHGWEHNNYRQRVIR